MPTLSELRSQIPQYQDLSDKDIIADVSRRTGQSAEQTAQWLGYEPDRDVGQLLIDLGAPVVLPAAVVLITLTLGMRRWATASVMNARAVPKSIVATIRYFRSRWMATGLWCVAWFFLIALIYFPVSSALSNVIASALGGSPTAAGFGGGAKGLMFVAAALCLKYGWQMIKAAFAMEPETQSFKPVTVAAPKNPTSIDTQHQAVVAPAETAPPWQSAPAPLVSQETVIAVRIDVDELYRMVGKEIQDGKLEPGIWARAFSESDGDEKKAKARYIKLRVESLRRARQVEIANARAEEDLCHQAEERRIHQLQTHREKILRYRAKIGSPEFKQLAASTTFVRLLLAARTRPFDTIQQMVAEDERLIYCPDSEGRTVLWIAVEEQRPRIVEALLQLGADSSHSVDGTPLIERAKRLRNPEIVDLLRAADVFAC